MADARAPRINGDRLNARLDRFARIGATAEGGVDRQALTEGDREARALLAALARERGFAVFQDPMANLFVRREGRCPDLAPMLIGSHLDTQPAGGRFDGALGTLAAFETLETLEDAGLDTGRRVEAVAWTNEEGCRFAPGCMGSAAFAARAIPEGWPELVGSDGAPFAQELAATLAALPEAAPRPLGFPVFAYLELHIEQAPALEREGVPLGIVAGVQGVRWLEVLMRGQTAHAGTTALADRRDPLRAMVAALDSLYAVVMAADADARLTVGRIGVSPGAVNAIPGEARCTLDIRHPESAGIDRIVGRAQEAFRREALTQGVVAETRALFDMAPARFPDAMLAALQAAADDEALATRTMISGAFHDALFVSRVAPAAMLFTPCRDGLSHNPAEFVAPQDAVSGCQALLSATLRVMRGRAV